MIQPIRTILLILPFLASEGLVSQSTRPLSIDDLITVVRVTDPQVSPDGKLVLFTRTTTSQADNSRNSDIWVVPADGSAPPRALYASAASDNSSRWLPDGRLLFISTREGKAQLYLGQTSGAEPRPITALPDGLKGPVAISPDGRLAAFIGEVYPPCTNQSCDIAVQDSARADQASVRIITRLPFRHWDEWRVRVRHHVFVVNIATGEIRDLTPGDLDAPPHNFEDAAFSFSPDSRLLAYVSKGEVGDEEMWSTNHEVFTVPVEGGNATRVTTNPAADLQPGWTPDGKLLVRAQRRPGFEADRWYLDLYDIASGSRRTIFTDPDLSVEDYAISRDGLSVWFTAQEQGRVNLYLVPLAGGSPRMVTRGGSYSDLRAIPDGVIATRSSLTAPGELVRITPAGDMRQITAENAGWLTQRTMSASREATVPGADGDPVRYWELLPPGFDSSRRYPTVFMIHGGPQSAWNDAWSSRWNPSLWAAQGWVVIAPNPRGSTGFGQKFTDQISGDWCGRPMVDLRAVFDHVASRSYVNQERMGIAGASYGGYAVDWIIGHDQRFKAAVSHDGVFNLESMAFSTEELWFTEWDMGGKATSPQAREHFARCSPHLTVDQIRTPTLIIHNDQDFRVPVDQGIQLFTALRRNGVESMLVDFPDEGHWVLSPANSKRWHELVFEWLRKYLGN